MKYRYLGPQSISQLAWWLICASIGLMSSVLHAEPVNVQGYVMHVQMTPAVCFVGSFLNRSSVNVWKDIHLQFWLKPETTRTDCSTESSAALSPLQAKVVARVMPTIMLACSFGKVSVAVFL